MKIEASVDVGNNIKSMLEKLATQLGVTVDKVFPYFVKQQVVEGIGFFCVIAVVTAASVIGLVVAHKLNLKNDGKYDADSHVPVYVTSGFCLLMAFVALMIHASTALGQIINPEYAAIRDIVRIIGK